MLLSRRLHLTYDCLRCQFVRVQVCSSEGILVLSIFVIFRSPRCHGWLKIALVGLESRFYGGYLILVESARLAFVFSPTFYISVFSSPPHHTTEPSKTQRRSSLLSACIKTIVQCLIGPDRVTKQTLHCSLDVESCSILKASSSARTAGTAKVSPSFCPYVWIFIKQNT